MYFLPYQTIKNINYICFSLLKLFEIAIHWVSLMTTPPGMAGFPWCLAVALPGESKVRPHAYDGRRGSFVWQIEETWTDDYLPSGKLTWLWNITILNGKTQYTWQISIAMLNYQRVSLIMDFYGLFRLSWWSILIHGLFVCTDDYHGWLWIIFSGSSWNKYDPLRIVADG